MSQFTTGLMRGLGYSAANRITKRRTKSTSSKVGHIKQRKSEWEKAFDFEIGGTDTTLFSKVFNLYSAFENKSSNMEASSHTTAFYFTEGQIRRGKQTLNKIDDIIEFVKITTPNSKFISKMYQLSDKTKQWISEMEKAIPQLKENMENEEATNIVKSTGGFFKGLFKYVFAFIFISVITLLIYSYL